MKPSQKLPKRVNLTPPVEDVLQFKKFASLLQTISRLKRHATNEETFHYVLEWALIGYPIWAKKAKTLFLGLHAVSLSQPRQKAPKPQAKKLSGEAA